MKIRIKFTKQGMMKYIGHLDTMRYFQKAMRRAEIDICYSEGFSPHQIMSFASPLGVGLTSQGEYLDIEVHSSASSAEMTNRLNGVMAEGTTILSCLSLPEGAKNAMSIVAAADYSLTFRDGYQPVELHWWLQELQVFLQQKTIPYIKKAPTPDLRQKKKKASKGDREIDLKPLIYRHEVNEAAIFLQVSAGSVDNLKPQLVIDAFCESRRLELSPFALQCQREEIYANFGDDKERKLLALEQLGEIIE